MKLTLLSVLAILMSVAQAFAHDVALTCTAGTGGGTVSGFNIKRASVAGGPYTTLNSTPLATCSFDDTSAAVQAEGTTFFYVMSATGPGGESPNSNEVSATIPFSAPATPTGPKAVPR